MIEADLTGSLSLSKIGTIKIKLHHQIEATPGSSPGTGRFHYLPVLPLSLVTRCSACPGVTLPNIGSGFRKPLFTSFLKPDFWTLSLTSYG